MHSTILEILELETWSGASFKAWTDAAREAGLVLRMPDNLDSGDYPENIYGPLRHFRRVMARAKGEPKKIVTHMHRQLVSTRDEKGKPTKKEYLTYLGYYEIFDHRGVPYHANLEVGKYEKPKVVANPSRRYNPETGKAIGPEKTFAGSQTVYTIEVPKSKTERKKLIDEIIGDIFPEEINYYYKSGPDEAIPRRDPTFSYDDFLNCTIEEMRKMSFQGGGSKTPGIWRDNDGKLRDKFGQLVTLENGNKAAYQ